MTCGFHVKLSCSPSSFSQLVPFLERLCTAAVGASETDVQTKKARSRDLAFIFVVRLAGIEPTTPWFVAKYSIQLSYSRPRHAL